MRRSRTEILHLSVKLQEQESQKRQLCEELERLKAPPDGTEVSCQTPEPEEELLEDLDWEEEEFALQDFLKNEPAESNCGAQEREMSSSRPEAAGKPPDRCDEEEEEEEERDSSTPLSAVLLAAPAVQASVEDDRDAEPEVNHQPLQKAAPLDAHAQAVGVKHPEADVLPDLSHSEESDEACRRPESSCGAAPPLRQSCEQERSVTSVDGRPPDSAAADPEETSCHAKSSRLTCEEPGGDEDTSAAGSSAADMRRHKSLIRDNSTERPAAEDGSCLLPVLVEEEESAQDTAAQAAGVNRLPRSENLVSPNSSSPPPTSITPDNQTGRRGSRLTSDPPQPEANQVFLRNMSAVVEHRVTDEQSQSSRGSEQDSETSVLSDQSDAFKEKRNSLSPNDKEIEAEFQRLSLGFKCDMFTLEKRLKLEQRSRDLAEENIRKEVSSCQGLLQALTPLCEDETQSMEIIQRLQKNLDILIQSTNRVSSRSEMLGAIHQENRIGKAVEVMIQHVENLKRTYTKEHAELLELRQALSQAERSFGGEDKPGINKTRDKKPGRRVSIASIPHSSSPYTHCENVQEEPEVDVESLKKRFSWNKAARGAGRHPLKRFGSSAARFDFEEPPDPAKGPGEPRAVDQEQQEKKETKEKRRPSIIELGNKISALILPVKTPSPPSTPTISDQTPVQPLTPILAASRRASAVAPKASRGVWLWLAIMVVLAGLLALLAYLVMQPAADAAPMGTGDSWMTIQQLLWPYTGLRHNAQPPV